MLNSKIYNINVEIYKKLVYNVAERKNFLLIFLNLRNICCCVFLRNYILRSTYKAAYQFTHTHYVHLIPTILVNLVELVSIGTEKN